MRGGWPLSCPYSISSTPLSSSLGGTQAVLLEPTNESEWRTPLSGGHTVSGPQSVPAKKAGSSCLPFRERLGDLPVSTAIHPGVKRSS